MTAGNNETPRWTSTTKRLPLSLQLWHKQHSFSPVLQPKAPALTLQKKCQDRVMQPTKPNSPAPTKRGQHWLATAWHTDAHVHTCLTLCDLLGLLSRLYVYSFHLPTPSQKATEMATLATTPFLTEQQDSPVIHMNLEAEKSQTTPLFVYKTSPLQWDHSCPFCSSPPFPFYLHSPAHTAPLAGF